MENLMESIQNKRIMILGWLIFIVPLFVCGIVMDQSDIEIENYHIFTSPFNVDLFSIGKARILLFFIFLLTLQFLFLFFTNKIQLKLSVAFIFIGVYLLGIILSTLTSEYKDIVYMGFSDRYEGVYVYFYYILLVCFSYVLIETFVDIKVIFNYLLVSVIPVAVIGVLQAFDIFPFTSNLVKPILYFFNDSYYDGVIQNFIMNSISKHTDGFDKVSSTLFNPNYLGVYSMLATLVSVLFLFDAKNLVGKWVYSFFVSISFLLLLLSGAKTGLYIGSLIVVIMMLLKFFEKGKRSFIPAIHVVSLFLLVFLISNTVTSGEIGEKLFHVSSESLGMNIMQDNEASSTVIDEEKSNSNIIKSIHIQDSYTEVTDNTSLVRLVNIDGVPAIDNLTEVNELPQWSFEFIENILVLKHYRNKLYFEVNENGKIGTYGRKGILYYVPDAIEPLINGHLFTHRGYIWSIAYNLIKEKPLTGYGADTFAIYQPDDDIINGANYSHSATSLAINPHNMYILLFFNFGIFGILGFVGFAGSIYIAGIIQYVKVKEKRELLSLTLLPLAGLLLASVFNDTIIGTGVVLYILLGIASVSVFKRVSY